MANPTIPRPLTAPVIIPPQAAGTTRLTAPVAIGPTIRPRARTSAMTACGIPAPDQTNCEHGRAAPSGPPQTVQQHYFGKFTYAAFRRRSDKQKAGGLQSRDGRCAGELTAARSAACPHRAGGCYADL